MQYYVVASIKTTTIIIINNQNNDYIIIMQISALAWEIQDKYFACNKEETRQVASELQSILKNIEDVCLAHESDMVNV